MSDDEVRYGELRALSIPVTSAADGSNKTSADIATYEYTALKNNIQPDVFRLLAVARNLINKLTKIVEDSNLTLPNHYNESHKIEIPTKMRFRIDSINIDGGDIHTAKDMYIAVRHSRAPIILYLAIAAVIVVLLANIYTLHTLERKWSKMSNCIKCILMLVIGSANLLYNTVLVMAFIVTAVNADGSSLQTGINVCWMESEATRLTSNVLLLVLVVVDSEALYCLAKKCRSVTLSNSQCFLLILLLWFIPELVDYFLLRLTTDINVIYAAQMPVILPYCLVDNLSDLWNFVVFEIPTGILVCLVSSAYLFLRDRRQRKKRHQIATVEDDMKKILEMEKSSEDGAATIPCACQPVYYTMWVMLTILMIWLVLLKPAMKQHMHLMQDLYSTAELPFFDIGTRLLLVSFSIWFPAMYFASSSPS